MLTTLILDLDDTLYDEIEYCKSGFRAAAEFIAQNENCPEKISTNDIFLMLKGEFESANTSRVFNSVLEKLQIPYEKGFINQLIEVYRNHFPDIHLPEDSREFLVTVKGEYNLGLLTDGFLPAQEYKVQALGIERYFEEIIYTEKLGREYWKPATLGFEKLLERFEVRPRQAVYIADNEKKDFIAPNKLGMKTIKIVRENQIHKSPPPVPEGKPRYIADNFSELKQLIKTI